MKILYPGDRAFFEGVAKDQLRISFAPNSDIAPIWNPEFFGNTMVVNGKTCRGGVPFYRLLTST